LGKSALKGPTNSPEWTYK